MGVNNGTSATNNYGGTHFTPVQQRMLDLLQDGNKHTKEELRKCLEDPESEVHNINMHLTYLRKKLRPKGYDLACETISRETRYRLVRLVSSGE